MHFNNDYYRAEINGLRAIAVLSVIAHHLKISGVENGFLGVNVFFVISGYVIFKKIIRETRAGAFTPLAFIKSRINRLLPALLVMILATSITAIFLLPPFELKEYQIVHSKRQYRFQISILLIMQKIILAR